MRVAVGDDVCDEGGFVTVALGVWLGEAGGVGVGVAVGVGGGGVALAVRVAVTVRDGVTVAVAVGKFGTRSDTPVPSGTT